MSNGWMMKFGGGGRSRSEMKALYDVGLVSKEGASRMPSTPSG